MKKLRQYITYKRYKKHVESAVSHTMQEMNEEIPDTKISTSRDPQSIYETLVKTLDDIHAGSASKEQKKSISHKIVNIAPITKLEKEALNSQISDTYK